VSHWRERGEFEERGGYTRERACGRDVWPVVGWRWGDGWTVDLIEEEGWMPMLGDEETRFLKNDGFGMGIQLTRCVLPVDFEMK
jgi:hypothetical protein